MYRIIWDEEINGVILTDKHTNIDNILHPRLVFLEELDLLKFNKFWKYPRTKKPLLWANGRRYYYRGEWVAEAKGGNIFESPQLTIMASGKDLIIEPINVDLMVRKNQEALSVLENEAMDFVEHTYKSYKRGRNKVDCFAVSFGGGKDSQVVLDIVSRIIPPDDYIVVFTDTDMELPSTYKNVEETKSYYQKLYTGLRFETAKGRSGSFSIKELTEKISQKTSSPRTAYNAIKALANFLVFLSGLLLTTLLKYYLESGIFTVANVRQTSSAGLILLGNIPLDSNKKPLSRKYFTELPNFFRDSALLDRFHGFIEGWRLPRINESLKVRGYTLNVEYFSEI